MLSLRHRHGARLDAADTQWHLTSPTPYDPPLTYGGWRQSQALGARIASIIHAREAAAGSQTSNGIRGGSEPGGESEGDEGRNLHHSYRGKRRRHKVVIHSSPFLRCIQTSVAISAGMAQYQGTITTTKHPSPSKHTLHSGPSHLRALDHGLSPHLSAIPEPEATGSSGRTYRQPNNAPQARTLLRVDAFLGEWLSPEYFDRITPPPESKLMVAGAKADLLRRSELVDTANASNKSTSSQGNFPGGWGSTASTSSKVQVADDATPLNDLSSLSQSLPRLGRANSHHVGTPMQRSSANVSSKVERSPNREPVNYVPPTPSYAISPSQPIPQGYVAHARDACVKVDYQWDSLRPPLDWGNGGAYGEEWSAMHKRFRRGLHETMSWYRNHDPVALVRTLSQGLPEPHEPDDRDDDERDTVLVLVTHGAGCNAMIGALTNQPVLLDVGMASLTMAVRKTIDYKRVASPSFSPQTSPSRRRRSVIDFGISDDYEVKITASTDHLRAGSQFLPGNRLQRTSTLPVREKSPYRYERPHFVESHHRRSPVFDDSDHHSESDSATPTKNETFEKLSSSSNNAVQSSGGGGLWSKPVDPQLEKVAETHTKTPARFPAAQMDGTSEARPNSSQERQNGLSANNKSIESKRASSASENSSQGRTITPSGLWGTPPQALATERDPGSKRRWTLSQAP